MNDVREIVSRGLRVCSTGPEFMENCREAGCPYADGTDCIQRMACDALELIAPRVLAPEELAEWDGAFLVETRSNGATVWASWYAEYEHYGETVVRMVDIGGEVDDRFRKLYGYEWRCWSARPTEEQRKAEKWAE